VDTDPTRQRLEDALANLESAHYELTLFVSGASVSSARAVRNARGLCETHLAGRYDLTIVDVNQDPGLARGRRVLATPTLLKDQPAPERMLVGDLSDSQSVLAALDIPVVTDMDPAA
jgi:circadian clock protein KaiB